MNTSKMRKRSTNLETQSEKNYNRKDTSNRFMTLMNKQKPNILNNKICNYCIDP